MQELHNIEQKIRETAAHRPISVKAIILTKTCNILLLTRPDRGELDLPGGGVDEGESLVEALIREVQEETGLDIDNAIPVYTFIRSTKTKPEKLIQFVICTLESDVADTTITLSSEHESYQFVDFSQTMTVPLKPSYREALQRAREIMQKDEHRC